MPDLDDTQGISNTTQNPYDLRREAQRDYPSIDSDTYKQISNIISDDSIDNRTRRLIPLYGHLGFRHGWNRGKELARASGRGDAAELKDLESGLISYIHELLNSGTATPESLTYDIDFLNGVRSAYFDSNVSAYRGHKPINFPEEKLVQRIVKLENRPENIPPEDQYFTEQESLSEEQLYTKQQLERIHPIFLDEKGNPKVIYHGSPTGRDIDECGYFDEEYYGVNTGVSKESQGFTIFGSDDEDVASTYTFGQRIHYPSLDRQRKYEHNLIRSKNKLEEAKETLEFKKQNPGQIHFIDEKLRILSEFYDDSIEYIENYIQKQSEQIPIDEIQLGYKRQIVPIHILSQNPLVVDGSTFKAGTKDFSITDHVNQARNEGYDSLVIENIDDPYSTQVSIPATQYAIWDPERVISAETGRSLAKSQEICILQERETPPEDQYFTEREDLSPEASHAQQQLERIHPVFLDEKGNPKIIYHGSPTGRDIDECGYFDESFYGENTGVRDLSQGFTIFGTDDINVADTYTRPMNFKNIDEQKIFTEFTNRIIESLDNALYFIENNELERNIEQGIKTTADNVLRDGVTVDQILEKYYVVQLDIDNKLSTYIFDDGSKIYEHYDSDNLIADKGQYDDLFIESVIEDKKFWERGIGNKLSIVPIHILSQNPLIVDGSTFNQDDKSFSITNNINRAVKEGYDSLVIENIDDTYDGSHNPATQYAIWDPERVISAETGRSLAKSQEICILQEHETPPEDQYFTEAPRAQQQLERIHPVFLDEKDNPKVIYHGSPSGRTISDCGYFDEEYYGDNTGVRDASEGFAVFASDNEEVANTYAESGSIYVGNLDFQKTGEKYLKRIIDRFDYNNKILQDRKDNPELLPLAEQSVNNGILYNYKQKIILEDKILPQDIAAYIFDDNSVLFKVNDHSNEINDGNLLNTNIDFYIGELFHTIRTSNDIPKNEHDDLIDNIRTESENSSVRLSFYNTLDSHEIDQKHKELGYDRMVLPIHILSQNPLIVDGSEFEQYRPGKFSITDNVNRAKKEGYDALVIENITDAYHGEDIPGTQYVVWDTERIIDAETGRSLAQSERICELQERKTPPEDQYFTNIHESVLDTEGNLRTVYHGSPKYQDIIEQGYFDKDKLGSHTGVAQDHPGFYFTSNPGKAKFYSLDKEHANALYLPTQALSKNKARIKELEKLLEYQNDSDGEYAPDIISYLEEQNISLESHIDSINQRFESKNFENDSRRGVFEANLTIQNPLIVDRRDIFDENNLSLIGKFEKQAINEGKDSLIIEDKESDDNNVYVVFDPSKIIDTKTRKKMTSYEGPYRYESNIPEDQYFIESNQKIIKSQPKTFHILDKQTIKSLDHDVLSPEISIDKISKKLLNRNNNKNTSQDYKISGNNRLFSRHRKQDNPFRYQENNILQQNYRRDKYKDMLNNGVAATARRYAFSK